MMNVFMIDVIVSSILLKKKGYMLKKLTIKQLLLLAFLLAGLLPAMLVSFLSFYQTRTVLKQEIQQDMQALSAAVAHDIERMMLERMRNIKSWSQLSIMQEAGIGDIDKRLSIFLNGLAESYGGMYQAIYVVDQQKLVIASSDASQIGQPQTTYKHWFKTNDKVRPLVFHHIEDHVLAISQDIIDQNTLQPMASLMVEFNWETIEQMLNNAATQSTAVALEDEHGRILAATRNWGSIKASHGIDALQPFSEHADIANWQIHIDKLRSVAIAPVHRLGYIFLALLFATIILAIFAVRPIAQAISNPIARLTEFVQQFTPATKKPPPQSGPPEVRELGQAFEKMMHDLEHSQSELTRAAKLAVVGEMAAAMSHEVRTPLGILRSSADVLKREKQLSDEGKEVLTFIDAETERMNKLVSTLIDAARPRQPVFTNLDLVQLIQGSIQLLGAKAQQKDIQIIFEKNDAKIQVEADADQMTQVMMNLMMNAIQVLEHGGQIIIRLTQSSEVITIDVMDDGQGIDPADSAKIFDSFFTKRAGGVGLGLAIVRQIVQTHHGKIHYQASEVGGAQFTITLPKGGRINHG